MFRPDCEKLNAVKKKWVRKSKEQNLKDCKNEHSRSSNNAINEFVKSLNWKGNIVNSVFLDSDVHVHPITNLVLEFGIEDYFDITMFRRVSKGWNTAVMNYLHQNLHVACWFKLQSCLMLKPQECHYAELKEKCADAMIRSLHQLNDIDAFDPKTDLLIVTKIISILYRAKEEHHA